MASKKLAKWGWLGLGLGWLGLGWLTRLILIFIKRTERYDPKWRPKPVKTVQNRPDPRQLREGSNPN